MLYRGFICCQSPEIRLEDALFVRYRLKNCPALKGKRAPGSFSAFRFCSFFIYKQYLDTEISFL